MYYYPHGHVIFNKVWIESLFDHDLNIKFKWRLAKEKETRKRCMCILNTPSWPPPRGSEWTSVLQSLPTYASICMQCLPPPAKNPGWNQDIKVWSMLDLAKNLVTTIYMHNLWTIKTNKIALSSHPNLMHILIWECILHADQCW